MADTNPCSGLSVNVVLVEMGQRVRFLVALGEGHGQVVPGRHRPFRRSVTGREILEAGPPEVPATGGRRVRRDATSELRHYEQIARTYGHTCISPSAWDEEGRALLPRACAALARIWHLWLQRDDGPSHEVLLAYGDFGQPVSRPRFVHEPWEIARTLRAVCPAAGDPADIDGMSPEEAVAAITAQVEGLESEAADLREYGTEHPQELAAFTE